MPPAAHCTARSTGGANASSPTRSTRSRPATTWSPRSWPRQVPSTNSSARSDSRTTSSATSSSVCPTPRPSAAAWPSAPPERLHPPRAKGNHMASENSVTVVGNLTRDPELRYTQSGTGLANMGLAVSRRYQVNGEWQEQTSFFNVVAWGDLGENAAASLTKGSRVIVTGRLEQRSYETKEGEKRSVVEIRADELGPSLRWAQAQVERISRDAADGGSRGGGGGGGGASRAPDPVYGDEEPF